MSIQADTTFSLKDQLFNPDTLAILAAGVASAYPGFKRKKFESLVLSRLDELQLKARIDWMAQCLNKYLPDDVSHAREILLRALPAPLDPNLADDDFGRFIWVVPGECIALSSCNDNHVDQGLAFLRESTKRFSAEFAIRPFLLRFPEQSMAFVHSCTDDANYHVRRLASEGIRPYLPWAPRANVPISDILPVLDRLHTDPTRYVTRSVANTLNDISKTAPDSVVETLQIWQGQGLQKSAELDWMTRHSLRTLLKNGHDQALALTGYPTRPEFAMRNVQASTHVQSGEALQWRGELHSKANQKLKIALRIHFLKANGGHGVKIFAVKDMQVAVGERVALVKNLPFKPMTTRVLYPGKHLVELSVNGCLSHKKAFDLLA